MHTSTSGDQMIAALAMTERALRLAPNDPDTQFTHAMLLIDAERAGVGNTSVLDVMPGYAPQVRINVAVRLGYVGHDRFGDAVDVVLSDEWPDQMLAEGGSGMLASYGDVATETFGELGEAILALAPAKMPRFVTRLPDDVELLFVLAGKAIEAGHRDHAMALYDRLLALPVPTDGDDRLQYLMALNNACIQAHAEGEFAAAARIADRAQPLAAENPYIYHSAACAYAAIGNLEKALEQVRCAVERDYEHLDRLETDADLGALLTWPQFKSLFDEWHVKREGN